MRYVELLNKFSIREEIEKIRQEYSDLSKIFIAPGKETTIKGLQVRMVFRNLTPILKIEADEELLNTFAITLEEIKKSY
ncbi:MAG TPA: hypothetical protein ENN41_08295 [Sediminispirochaeta sp.]|nr:hypothetical protein [Sediminispirochaeta sp.]